MCKINIIQASDLRKMTWNLFKAKIFFQSIRPIIDAISRSFINMRQNRKKYYDGKYENFCDRQTEQMEYYPSLGIMCLQTFACKSIYAIFY